MSRLVSSGSTEGTSWTFRPGTLRWRLICDVMVTFSYLVFVPDDPFDDRPQAFVLVVHFFLSLMQVSVVVVKHHDECDHCWED